MTTGSTTLTTQPQYDTRINGSKNGVQSADILAHDRQTTSQSPDQTSALNKLSEYSFRVSPCNRADNFKSSITKITAGFQAKLINELSINNFSEVDRLAFEAVNTLTTLSETYDNKQFKNSEEISLATIHFNLYSFDSRLQFGTSSLPGMILMPLLEAAINLNSTELSVSTELILTAKDIKERLSNSFKKAAESHNYGEKNENTIWRINLLSSALVLDEQIFGVNSRQALQTKMAIQTTYLSAEPNSTVQYYLPEKFRTSSYAESEALLRLDITQTVNEITENMLAMIAEFDERHKLFLSTGQASKAHAAYHDGITIARKVHRASDNLRQRKS